MNENDLDYIERLAWDLFKARVPDDDELTNEQVLRIAARAWNHADLFHSLTTRLQAGELQLPIL